MYEQIKDYVYALKRQITVKRCIIGACCLLFVLSACQLIDGYLTARGNYNSAINKLERTQRALDESRRLNRELQLSIERSTILNREAERRIRNLEDYQRRTSEGINRAQEYQRETEQRVSESLKHNRRAREELKSSLELIKRIEAGNQKQQTDGAAPASPTGHLGDQ